MGASSPDPAAAAIFVIDYRLECARRDEYTGARTSPKPNTNAPIISDALLAHTGGALPRASLRRRAALKPLQPAVHRRR